MKMRIEKKGKNILIIIGQARTVEQEHGRGKGQDRQENVNHRWEIRGKGERRRGEVGGREEVGKRQEVGMADGSEMGRR